jgi:hypothetical protein
MRTPSVELMTRRAYIVWIGIAAMVALVCALAGPIVGLLVATGTYLLSLPVSGPDSKHRQSHGE